MTDADASPLQDDRAGAVFSDDGTYRYRLWRTWDAELPAVAFIMLNPSTADEVELDPTCRRCKGYAEKWGFGKLIVGNIFALKATKPRELYGHDDPMDVVGPENDYHLTSICEDAELVVAAWGAHGDLHGRGSEVARSITSSGVDLFALNTTQDGHPNHPLYQRKDAELERYHWDGDA